MTPRTTRATRPTSRNVRIDAIIYGPPQLRCKKQAPGPSRRGTEGAASVSRSRGRHRRLGPAHVDGAERRIDADREPVRGGVPVQRVVPGTPLDEPLRVEGRQDAVLHDVQPDTPGHTQGERSDPHDDDSGRVAAPLAGEVE